MAEQVPDLPVEEFASAQAWERWLRANHAKSPGLWLKIAKKGSGTTTVEITDAIETALCYGWIDGLRHKHDDVSFRQRFTPRTPRSKWSQINRDRAEALIAEGRMRPAGQAQVDAAKADGRWDAAYAGSRTIEVPDDLARALRRDAKARRAFEALDSANRYAILYRIHDAKRPETRARRIEQFIAMLAEGRTLHQPVDQGESVPENLQWQIGDVTITRVVESVANIPAGGLLPSASAEVIASHASWLRPHFVDDDGNLVLSIHAFGITAGDRRIIVDTCIGNDRQIPGMEALNLQTPFLTDLAAAGFPREEVDTVICTHLHFDHVGWNTMLVDGEWVPTFPNARYLLCRDEWEHWNQEGASGYAATIDDAVRPVVDAGLADLVPSDHRVTDEIRLEATPGHTPGHVAVHVESGGQHALITGDLADHPVQFAQPDWFADPDTDREQSSATRRRLLSEHCDTDVLVIGTHFAPPCAGRITADGNGWRFDAVAPQDA